MDRQIFDILNKEITNKLSDASNVSYAINAARLALFIFEHKYPYDDRALTAIQVAEHLATSQDFEKLKIAVTNAAYTAYAAYTSAEIADTYATYLKIPHAAGCAASYTVSAYGYYNHKLLTYVMSRIVKWGCDLLKDAGKKLEGDTLDMIRKHNNQIFLDILSN